VSSGDPPQFAAGGRSPLVRKSTGLRPQTCRPQLCARANPDPVIKVRKDCYRYPGQGEAEGTERWSSTGAGALLAEQGLVPALQAQARKASLQVEIDADSIGRYPQDTGAAVYFCTLEALQNITKYASASRAKVRLSCSDDNLQFTVTDDGTGFDTATTRYGTGLQGMADRLGSPGGALQVRSQPGHGTILSGELPLTASGRG
jgi:signal transduction histidine kinase